MVENRSQKRNEGEEMRDAEILRRRGRIKLRSSNKNDVFITQTDIFVSGDMTRATDHQTKKQEEAQRKRGNKYWLQFSESERNTKLEEEARQIIASGVRLSIADLRTKGYSAVGRAIQNFYPGGFPILREKLEVNDTVKIRRFFSWKQVKDPASVILAEADQVKKELGNFTSADLHHKGLLIPTQRYYPGGYEQLRKDLGLPPPHQQTWSLKKIEEEALKILQHDGEITAKTLRTVQGLRDAVLQHYPGKLTGLKKKLQERSWEPVKLSENDGTILWFMDRFRTKEKPILLEEDRHKMTVIIDIIAKQVFSQKITVITDGLKQTLPQGLEPEWEIMLCYLKDPHGHTGLTAIDHTLSDRLAFVSSELGWGKNRAENDTYNPEFVFLCAVHFRNNLQKQVNSVENKGTKNTLKRWIAIMDASLSSFHLPSSGKDLYSLLLQWILYSDPKSPAHGYATAHFESGQGVEKTKDMLNRFLAELQ